MKSMDFAEHCKLKLPEGNHPLLCAIPWTLKYSENILLKPQELCMNLQQGKHDILPKMWNHLLCWLGKSTIRYSQQFHSCFKILWQPI
jgi:hypothetical protein